MRTLQPLAVFMLAVAVAADGVPASRPTCPNGDSSCEPPRPPTCSVWYDGEYVFSGQAGLVKGETVGEPDLVIPWHNHDRWVWTTWHRYNQMFEKGDKDEHIFAPGFHYPHTCHKSLANLDVSDPSIVDNNVRAAAAATATNTNNMHYAVNQSIPLMANRAIARGDALFTTCRHPDLSSKVELHDVPEYIPGYFRDECTCMDVITLAQSSIPNAGMGAFSKYKVPRGKSVIFAAALHMLRSELHNETSNEDELLLNYAFGDPTGQTQLLLVPSAPGVNY